MVRKIICEECGQEFEADSSRKFCSSSCAATHNNRGRIRSLESRKRTSESVRKAYHGEVNEFHIYGVQICENCGCEIHDHFTKRRFCSCGCAGKYKHKTSVNEWLKHPEKFDSPVVYPFIKAYMMELHNNKCELCGWGETNTFSGLIPLEVHHINGDSTDNRIENLQLLCPNCHSLTGNYGIRNKGKSKRFVKTPIV